jgi:ABC-2 type transport system permease protein
MLVGVALSEHVESRRRGAPVTSSIVEVWNHRDALRLLVRRDLTVKYQQSLLGYLWSMLEPLSVALTYWFVFSVLYHTKPAGGEPYILFLVSGLFAWIWVSGVLGEATVALTQQHRLITTIKVPREVFPIGRVLAKFAEYLAALPVLILVAILCRAHVGWNLLLLPVAIVLQMMFLIGLSLLLSSLNVMLQDVERFMRLLQRLLMYAVPVIYPLSKVLDSDMPHWVKTVYQLNPLVGIFELHHAAWLGSTALPRTGLVLTATIGSVVSLLAGWLVFRRLEPSVLKEL